MKVCLAGTTIDQDMILNNTPPYILESFYYFKDWQKVLLKKCDLFLLDSGAFTFMSNAGKAVDWEEYLTKYIAFINKYDIKYFFELDIDSVVGYERVKKLRKRLEKETGKQCIPVWHKSRGIEEYKKLCEEYKYIAIGGIVSKEIMPNEYNQMFKLVKYAKAKGVKVHGLGFTNLKVLKDCCFDSVDSTSWLSGGRFGQLYLFKGNTLQQVSFKDRRIKNYKEAHIFNLNEWIKFVKYADRYL